uniref:Signal recognition particle 14 kDa protein n=1 Tax=Canis lupus familiaris TaxID=9615 RepID=A0A8I3PB37_CANLF
MSGLNESFLTSLHRLLSYCELKGSVYFRLKKKDARSSPVHGKGYVEGFHGSDNKCIRLFTDQTKKIFSLVPLKETNKIIVAYTNFVRWHLSGLKKKKKYFKSKKRKPIQ